VLIGLLSVQSLAKSICRSLFGVSLRKLCSLCRGVNYTSDETLECKDDLMSIAQIEIDRVVTEEVNEDYFKEIAVNQEKKSKDNFDAVRKHRKDAIEGLISFSVCLQRLYFIIRSSIMGLITGLLTFSIISFFEITNFFALVLIGLVVFVISLFLSRVFDRPIVRFSSLTVKYLKKHRRLRVFVLSRF
jgi:hypothetical protein